MAGIFGRLGLTYGVTMKARFGTMVCSRIGRGLGIAAIPIVESTEFQTCIAFRRDAVLSSYGEHFIALLRREMEMLHAGKAAGRRQVTSDLQNRKS